MRVPSAGRAALRDYDQPHVGSGSWSCQNVLPGEVGKGQGGDATNFSCFDYARIAAISGWMPMMFMTRVRL